MFFACVLVLALLSFAALYLAYRNAPEGRQEDDGFTAGRPENSTTDKDAPTRARKRSSRHRTR